jgi:hypothetical protein
MKTATLAGSLRYASGEELLLLTVFGARGTKRVVDRELDRRASVRRSAMRLRAAVSIAPASSTKRAA